MNRDRYAEAKERASYYWSVERNGLVIAEEYDVFGNDVALRTANLTWVTLTNGTDGFRNDSDSTIRVHAKPYRETTHQCFYFDIAPKEVLIWKHLVFGMALNVGLVLDPETAEELPTPSEPLEYLIFGRVDHNGNAQTIFVHPEGMWSMHETADVREIVN